MSCPILEGLLARSQRLLHPAASKFLPAEQAAMIHEKAADIYAWMMRSWTLTCRSQLLIAAYECSAA
jgi:hypothetical protein